MKLRYGNGFSISLWSEEIEEVEIQDLYIRYRTPSGKYIRIMIPTTWVKQKRDSDSDDCQEHMKQKKNESLVEKKLPGSQSEASDLQREKAQMKDEVEKLKKL